MAHLESLWELKSDCHGLVGSYLVSPGYVELVIVEHTRVGTSKGFKVAGSRPLT